MILQISRTSFCPRFHRFDENLDLLATFSAQQITPHYTKLFKGIPENGLTKNS